MSPEERILDLEFWERIDAIDLSKLPAEQRRWNGYKWAECARMEHASIASFSKFSLQLLGLGAPAALIKACHEAALDEVEHARISFALASRFLGEALGPGPLPLEGEIIASRDLLAVCCETVIDGCIEESLAAQEAAVARGEAKLGTIETALAIIERDEARHADLAWRTVAWALSVAGPELGAALRIAFEQALARIEGTAVEAESHERGFTGYGHLPKARRLALRARHCRDVLRPAVDDLFALLA
ncbi:MAG: hypothetical protein OEZ06_28880 [Myxococcales bacterium]|nr:hypothetical protein [Myxococcales bacterium]